MPFFLLFDGTLRLFNGWLCALVGIALAGLAATTVTAVALMPIEQEVVQLQGWRGGGVLAVVDPQALPTLVLATAVAILVATLAAVRMGSALRYAPGPVERMPAGSGRTSHVASTTSATTSTAFSATRTTAIPGRDRATGVAEALTMSVRREQRTGEGGAMATIGGRNGFPTGGCRDQRGSGATGSASAARRTTLRRSRSATHRDRAGR